MSKINRNRAVQSKGRKRLIPQIKVKSAFRGVQYLGALSPGELQEWTGEDTQNTEGFPGLPRWPLHDSSSEVPVTHEEETAKEEPHPHFGRTWPDILHSMFSGEYLWIATISVIVLIFGFIYYQDNDAGKLQNFQDISWSLKKAGIYSVIVLILFLFACIGIWFRKRKKRK